MAVAVATAEPTIAAAEVGDAADAMAGMARGGRMARMVGGVSCDCDYCRTWAGRGKHRWFHRKREETGIKKDWLFVVCCRSRRRIRYN